MGSLSYSGRGFAFLWALWGVHPCHVYSSPRGFGVIQVGTLPDVLVMEPKLALATLPGLCFGGTHESQEPWAILMPRTQPYGSLIPQVLPAFLLPCPAAFPVVLSKFISEWVHWHGFRDTSGAFQILRLALGGAALLLNLLHLGLSPSVLKLYCKGCCVQTPPSGCWPRGLTISPVINIAGSLAKYKST